jgi:hypothetical protein
MNILRAIARPIANWFAAARHIVRYAPWLLLPILLTEGAQHVAEIQLGMFASRDTFTALANDPTRWAFGYAKIAGLFVSLLLAARVVALGSAARAIRPRLKPLFMVIGLVLLTSAIDLASKSEAARAVAPVAALQAGNLILQIPLTVALLAALFEDDWASLRSARWRVLGAVMLSGLLAAIAFVPMQLVHGLNHRWALGAPDAALWGLMAFDTLWTAAIALMTGTGMAIGWRHFIPASKP